MDGSGNFRFSCNRPGYCGNDLGNRTFALKEGGMLVNSPPEPTRRVRPGLGPAIRAVVCFAALLTAWLLLGGPLPYFR